MRHHLYAALQRPPSTPGKTPPVSLPTPGTITVGIHAGDASASQQQALGDAVDQEQPRSHAAGQEGCILTARREEKRPSQGKRQQPP